MCCHRSPLHTPSESFLGDSMQFFCTHYQGQRLGCAWCKGGMAEDTGEKFPLLSPSHPPPWILFIWCSVISLSYSWCRDKHREIFQWDIMNHKLPLSLGCSCFLKSRRHGSLLQLATELLLWEGSLKHNYYVVVFKWEMPQVCFSDKVMFLQGMPISG